MQTPVCNCNTQMHALCTFIAYSIPLALFIIGIVGAAGGLPPLSEKSWGITIISLSLASGTAFQFLFMNGEEKRNVNEAFTAKGRVLYLAETLCYIALGALLLSGKLSFVQTGHGLWVTCLVARIAHQMNQRYLDIQNEKQVSR